MIHSFVLSDGKQVGRDLELEALRLVRSDKGLLVWVDLDNPTDEEIKNILEGVFQFHPLAIEDCVTPSPLPKIEDYEEYLFLVMHAVDFSREEKFATTELDLFIGKDYLVTFHRTPLKSVQTMMDRMAKATGVIARGPDRLAHTLLDLMVDNYQPIMDELRSELEDIEELMIGQAADDSTVPELLQVRGDFSRFRAIVRPQRDVIDRLARGDNRMIRSLMLPYFRDLRDNLARFDEATASYHERLLMAFDIFLNKAAFEASKGIKFLTALTAITIPVTVVGTWYGMNFQNTPEYGARYGYYIAAAVTLFFTAVIWGILKRKRWF
jgi:magnesium transporter